MKLSIIIPVYKVEHYLERCLDSLVNQIPDGSEIILVDDGSPDRCGEICDEYGNRFEFIHVLHQENAGLSCARNAGLNYIKEKNEVVSKFDYVIFIDSDDYVEETSISEIINCLENNPCEVLVTRARVVSDEEVLGDKMNYSVPVGYYDGKVYFDLIQRGNNGMATSCVMFNVYSLAFLKNNEMNFYPGIMHEDELWTGEVFLLAEQVYVSNICFYNHYIRAGSLMHSNNDQKSADSTRIVCTELIKLASKYDNRSIRTFYDRIVFLYLRGYLKNDMEHVASYRFLQRSFLLRHAYFKRQRMKAVLYCISPSLYYRLLKKQ